MEKLDLLAERLKDQRSKRVVFMSHCLLNTNTRYLGGAFREGAVSEIAEYFLKNGVGIVQMKCPEQWAWGGIRKRFLWISLGSQRTILFTFKPILLKAFLIYTRMVYKKIARETITMICDYLNSGYTVIGIIGIDGSPTCGVKMRLDMDKAFSYFAVQKVNQLNTDTFNRNLYRICAAAGKGMFFEELQRGLTRKKLTVPLYSHSLIAELENVIDYDNWRIKL